MTQVVQLACPGCKQALRVPAEWVNQSMRCKHCGLTFQARAKAPAAIPPKPAPVAAKAAPPAPAKPSRAVAVQAPPPPAAPVQSPPTATAVAVATQVAYPVPAGGGFGDMDFDSSSPAKPRPRRRSQGGGGWIVLLVGVALMLIVGTVAALGVPMLVGIVANSSGQGTPFAAGPTNPDDNSTAPGEGGTPSTGTKPTPLPLPRVTGLSPRRALVISVNNYVYFNPVNYGSQNLKGSSVETLAERLSRGLSVPTTQVYQLSDGIDDSKLNDKKKPNPPLKSVIEKAVTDFLATSRAQDRVMVFFIGHAVEMDDDVFLVPVEGEYGNKESLIPLKWFYDQLAAANVRQKVLVLDVCRFNPSRGLERPGSGLETPEEGKPKGALTVKMEAMMTNPPAGVQVWTACVADQHSVEYQDGNLNNGAFVQGMTDVLLNGVAGTIQKPEEPIPLEKLNEHVNGQMKKILTPLNKKQTARLAGTMPEEGAAFNPKEPEPQAIAFKLPPPPDGTGYATLNTINRILEEVRTPPLKISKQDTVLRAQALPPFSAKVMADYLPDEGKTPFRDAIKNARTILEQSVNGQANKRGIQDEFRVPGDVAAFNKDLETYQRNELAPLDNQLKEALQELELAGKEGRAAESNKRWQANYDYIRARLKCQIAYVYEYQSLLGNAKKGLPDYDPKLHNGWRIASSAKPEGDRDGQRFAKDGRKIFEQMKKDYEGTPWEVLAKRDLSLSLGLEWAPTKIGE